MAQKLIEIEIVFQFKGSDELFLLIFLIITINVLGKWKSSLTLSERFKANYP